MNIENLIQYQIIKYLSNAIRENRSFKKYVKGNIANLKEHNFVAKKARA